MITNPTNLYSQEQFPNMDLAMTFHMGLCLRIPRPHKVKTFNRRLRAFGDVFLGLSNTSDALGQARNIADYQAIGMRCREVLLAFIGAAQDAHSWTEKNLPYRADYRAWAEIICNTALPGGTHKERRHLMKSLLEGAWTFTNWLTHARSFTWHDAETAMTTVEHVVGLAASLVIRHSRGIAEQCPQCGSPNLAAEEDRSSEAPEVLWERPICEDCGWTGKPVPLAELALDDQELELISRKGSHSADDAHVIPEVPLRTLRKPGDR
ncbi:MAG: hypothetical protein M3N38_10920 [Pseudomonadota bacterium]|nr:hypothetical protein [Pseudomonadota bacterium]